jgi:hypothetical protein
MRRESTMGRQGLVVVKNGVLDLNQKEVSTER